MNWKALLVGLLLLLVCKAASLAQHDGPALPDENLSQDQLIQRLSHGGLTIRDLRRKGLEIFTTPFNTHDGFGDGSFNSEFPTSPLSNRPTLQGNGLSLRVNGLDAQSCNECHSIVKQSTLSVWWRRVGITGQGPVPGEDGVLVPLFADLKRHDMGDGLEEDFQLAKFSNREFTTARLWGVADTAPYLHDGRATTLFQAIEAHGGEAQASRDAFLELSAEERQQLISFLGRLRTPNRPNQELLPLVSPPIFENQESPVCLFLECLRVR